MKRFSFFFCLLFSQWSLCQLDFKNSNVGRIMEFTDLSGQSLLKKYDPDITGSPFITDNWVRAKITLSKGKEIDPLLIKFNLESNELYYLDSVGKEMIAVTELIRKIEYTNFYANDSNKYIFKSGYPAIDKQDENYIYQVLTDGKIELLAKRFKYIRVEKDELSGNITKEFVNGVVVLYVYAYGVMHEFHPTKDFIFSLFEENKEQAVHKFFEENKINFRKTSDLIKLFNYYNILP